MTGEAVRRLGELLEKATPGDLATAERHIEHEVIECPVCQGDGEVDATDYCNIDHKALGVQFYGVGPEFGAHEALWSAVMQELPALLTHIAALEAERDEARAFCDGWHRQLEAVAVLLDLPPASIETAGQVQERITALEAERDGLREALKPFAVAAEDLDDKHGDSSDIWEAPAAMSITAGDLRDARAAAQASGEKQHG